MGVGGVGGLVLCVFDTPVFWLVCSGFGWFCVVLGCVVGCGGVGYSPVAARRGGLVPGFVGWPVGRCGGGLRTQECVVLLTSFIVNDCQSDSRFGFSGVHEGG